MLCEGTCGRSFRNGERVFAIPTRIVVVRAGREQFTVVDKLLCEADARLAGYDVRPHAALGVSSAVNGG